MESLTDNRRNKRFLKSKAEEIRSLKRKLENELNELEEINSYYAAVSENGKEIFSDIKLKNAKELISRTNQLLEKNDADMLSSENMEIDLSINQFTGEELRRERAGELFQYGFEVKYLPLARYLQTASKYISTENWCAAREEFRLARVFDRYLELRNGKASLLLQLQQQSFPARRKTQHDAILEEISWMSNDFRCETAWKQKIARQLALEAREYVFKKNCYWPISKPSSIFNCKIDETESFYLVDADSAELISRIPSPAASDDVPIERDELKTLCRSGDHLDNSTTGDLIITAEYQLGTSASFPGVDWYEHEDALLIEFASKYRKNWSLIANILNVQIYGCKPIRGPRGCQTRHEELVQKSAIAKPQLLSGDNPSLIHPHLLEKHNVKLTLMRGSTTKIITPRSIVPKKISFNVHPSHEAAARKANQNISKLLTPSELAQRRLQRTRLINDSGTLNVPSIPRSTPSPIPSNVSSSTANVSQPIGSPSVLNIPNLPSQFPSVNAPLNLSAIPQQQQQLQNSNNNNLIRPPSGPQPNHISVQLQQLQQLQQMQNAHRKQQQNQNFSESPSKMAPQRPPMQNGGQIRPPSNFMNLPSGLTAIQIQQLQQKQVQANQMQQASQLQQMQQMYMKAMQARPTNSNPAMRPVSGNPPNPVIRRPASPQPSGSHGNNSNTTTILTSSSLASPSLSSDPQSQDASGNIRTSPRKSINK